MEDITILGGGIGGLSVAYYAKKNQLTTKIIEASGKIGGNCITNQHNGFYFDSGAHRFHDKDRTITKEVLSLLKDQIKLINVPSKIYHNGKLIDFPLSPLNLMANLGLFTFTKAASQILAFRLANKSSTANFKKFSQYKYGNILADAFLLNYSEKLWGVPASKLSINASGKRMKGLDLKTFIREAFLGTKSKTEHLDGVFYYPKRGIGNIIDHMGCFIGKEDIFLNNEITQVNHHNNKITHLELNSNETIEVNKVVNSIPLNAFLRMMKPSLPKKVLEAGSALKCRDMILVAIFLNNESITKAATIYFPDKQFIFTRLYEPKNRHKLMAPQGKTSLVVEIPCQRTDSLWQQSDDQITKKVKNQLKKIFGIRETEIIDSAVRRMYYAYPILEITAEKRANFVLKYLDRFTNLAITGRPGKFQYTHIHDIFRQAAEILDLFKSSTSILNRFNGSSVIQSANEHYCKR
ncbi:MAG: protoporphyrinogen/coproporphyrinogen oxidase [Candidatus Heimdallarchaeota archaeon]